MSWPLRSRIAVDQPKKPADGQKKQRNRSWLGPLIALIVLIILGGVGAYIFINLLQRQPSPAVVENLTANKKEEVTPADKQPPVISDIQINNLSNNSVEIHWTTNEPSTSQVIWNPKNNSTNTTIQKEAMVQQHSVELAGLITKTTYYFKVRSIDASGNEALSAEKSFDIGRQPALTGVAVTMNSMSVEEKPPFAGVRTYIRGQIRNTGEVPLNIKDIEVTVKITVPGIADSSEVLAEFDPYPTEVNPGETHKFFAIVPNNTNPNYTVSARVLNK
ncbi:MAG: fibronectin type III domain-containing protein [Chloroflexi bacterium]|nr:fibronectin type III domain-containing protein [Chloroflexota bacterium]